MRHQETERDQTKKVNERETHQAKANRIELTKITCSKKEKSEDLFRPPQLNWKDARQARREHVPAKIVTNTDGQYPNANWRAI